MELTDYAGIPTTSVARWLATGRQTRRKRTARCAAVRRGALVVDEAGMLGDFQA